MTIDDTKIPAPSKPEKTPSGWRRGGTAFALVAGGFVLGTISLGSAAGIWDGTMITMDTGRRSA